ncbi:retrovirus-related pol polyprotein from transposon TNT 1-94 [Tanacetum coccineum]
MFVLRSRTQAQPILSRTFCDDGLDVCIDSHSCHFRNYDMVGFYSKVQDTKPCSHLTDDMIVSFNLFAAYKCLFNEVWFMDVGFGMGKISSNIGYETPQVIEKFIVKTQRALNATVRFVRTDNGTEFNGVVERQNRTLMEAARTMLIFAKAPLFLWAEAVATAERNLIFNTYECLDLVLPTNDYDDVGQTQGESRYRYICWSIAPSMKAYESTINERKVSGNVHVALMRFTEGVKSVQTSQARLKKDFCAKQSELELIAFTVRTQRSA